MPRSRRPTAKRTDLPRHVFSATPNGAFARAARKREALRREAQRGRAPRRIGGSTDGRADRRDPKRAARGSTGAVDRSTARATAISIALHAVGLAGALLLRYHAPDGPAQGTVINAELVTDLGSLSAP